MQGFQRDSSKIKAMKDKIKIKFILSLLVLALLCLGCVSARAQELTKEKFKFTQSMLVDSSQHMTFEEVLNATFTPIQQSSKLPTANNSVWLEIQPKQTDEMLEDLYLKVLPVLLTKITLYQSTEKDANVWDITTVEANDLNAPVKLGRMAPDRKIFLHVSSNIDFRMYLSIDNQDSMTNFQRRIDMFFAMALTMMLIIGILSIYHLVSHFNWVSVGALMLSITAACCWVCLMGFLPLIFGINQNIAQEILPVFLCSTIFIFTSFWFVIADQLFKDGRRIKLGWGVVIVVGLNLLYSFYDGSTAVDYLAYVFQIGRWALFVILILQAMESRNQLTLMSEKITFLLLILPIFRPTGLLFEYMGVFFTVENTEFIRLISLRIIGPFTFFMMTFWSYNKFTNTRISSLSGKLNDANLNLEKETLRLDQQRKFTAMIAHELKNPLMASQMALSVIQNRLLPDDPTQLRAQSIGRSLQEIDDIIERCSEIDKYEQGYMPLTFEKIRIKDLLASIKASQDSERIYAITRSIHSDFEFRTDTHYLKIILNNLLTNALKYSVNETLIEFKVERLTIEAHELLLFTVSNELLPGAAPDPLRVFERYYRAESAKKQSGAGLGLWLSQSMAQALGSRITLTIEKNIIQFQFSLLV